MGVVRIDAVNRGLMRPSTQPARDACGPDVCGRTPSKSPEESELRAIDERLSEMVAYLQIVGLGGLVQ